MTKKIQSNFNPASVEGWLSRELAAGRLEGGALEVHHTGKTVYTNEFGTSNSYGEAVRRDTMFWIASMTKPVVSVAAMRLIERDELSLSDWVSDFVPGFGEHGVLTSSGDLEAAKRPPTILDLMTHTSGVTYDLFGNEAIHRRYAQAQVFDFRSNNVKIAEKLANLPLLYQPGTVFEYGMSTDMLGRVIEVLTGLPLDDALQDLVLGPLGMNDTSFLPDAKKIADIPPSAIRDNIAPLISPEQTWWSGGGGLYSTVTDYMRFARMLLHSGKLDGIRVLRPQTVALMRQDHLPENVKYGNYTAALGITAPWTENGLGFGLGFAVRTKCLDHVPGGMGEYLWPGVSGANFWTDPENDLIVVFLTHAPDHRSDHRIGLRNAVYAGLNWGNRT
ncbi:MAG: beta-lactamase family protein [Kordiimonadaceae bacterium]|nr:beta-lactamase family protein [Kordiimonadaceae bacterium]